MATATTELPKLYLLNDYGFSAPVSQLVTGKTVTVKICATKRGDPAAIGSLTDTATEGASAYEVTFDRAAILTDLGDMVGKRVSVHVDDGADYHASREYVVSDEREF